MTGSWTTCARRRRGSAAPISEIVAERTLAEIPGLRGNLLHDVHTAVRMRAHGISTIYTRDSDFHRFPFLRVVDPLSD